jgi:hypothetical protein
MPRPSCKFLPKRADDVAKLAQSPPSGDTRGSHCEDSSRTLRGPTSISTCRPASEAATPDLSGIETAYRRGHWKRRIEPVPFPRVGTRNSRHGDLDQPACLQCSHNVPNGECRAFDSRECFRSLVQHQFMPPTVPPRSSPSIPSQPGEERLCDSNMFVSLRRIHFFRHRTHHRPARVSTQLLDVVPDPSPVEAVPDRRPIARRMVAHFSNV